MGEGWKLDAASKFKKKESSLFSNKELKSENKLFQEFLKNILVVCKSGFFLMVKAHG